MGTHPNCDGDRMTMMVCVFTNVRIGLPCCQLNECFRSSFSELIPHIFGIFDEVDALMAMCNVGRVGEDGIEED